jgi:hypothetical protein
MPTCEPEAKPTTAQTAEEIADWCSQSPTIGIAIDQTGYKKQQHVDFGGNFIGNLFDKQDACEWLMELFGADKEYCYE